MSLKQALFLTILAFITANNMCSCLEEKTENEMEEFREFLLNLPTEVENEQKYPVIPGEISTLVPCSDCVGRMKREIFIKPKRYFKKISYRPFHDEARNRCPLRYRRIAFMCVRE
ncbi:unnamed protein product [Euphydryas editha]|uniref:Uncharacterized protein n=1 Tax=Euphydryas editha TaxID=104508 RepID=A0AAU9UMR5_EUPED|nr:unnamed protein product [Euphydryas editha]